MRFTIAICTYNRSKYLAQSLDAVCAQLYPPANFECIVVDNNSPDDTIEVVSVYIHKFGELNIRYVKEMQQGISYARNRSIEEARGEFIIYLDDDETIDSDYLQKLDQMLLVNPHIDFAASAVEPVYETEKPKWLSHFTMRLITGYYNKGDKIKRLYEKDYPGTGHTIIRKNLYDRFGLFNTNLGRKGDSLLGAEDKDMSLRLVANGVDCYYLPHLPVYHHIPARKLTDDFFCELTYSIGKSERLRTLYISNDAYYKRLLGEVVKWSASWVLFVFYCLSLSPSKGFKLLKFRWNVTRGLLGK